MTRSEKISEYAKKLYHYLRTEQFITFDNHSKKPELDNFFAEHDEVNNEFYYGYINEVGDIILERRKL